MIITLIGFMGSGKTYIGNKLSISSNLPFIDLDYYISKKCKLSINDIFLNFGESYFRKKENESLIELSLKDNFILSSGGGIIELPKNRLILKDNKFLKVFLNPDLETIMERIYHSKRPIVKKSSRKDLISLYQKRLNYYYDLADISIQTTDSDQIIQKILEIAKNS